MHLSLIPSHLISSQSWNFWRMIPPMEPQQPVQPVQPRHFPPPAAQRTVSRQRSFGSSSMPPHVGVESSARLWRNLESVDRWRLSCMAKIYQNIPHLQTLQWRATRIEKNCKAKLRLHLLLSGSAITEVARRRRHMAERSWMLLNAGQNYQRNQINLYKRGSSYLLEHRPGARMFPKTPSWLLKVEQTEKNAREDVQSAAQTV